MHATPLHLPLGWIRAGSAPERYDIGVIGPGAPAEIRSRARGGDPGTPSGKAPFGTLMQSIVAGNYRGKRVRLTAELRTEDVDGAGTIWMRVDGSNRMLRFDNMEQRPRDGVLTASHDWTERTVVLDVPPDAESIHYGFYLRGHGRALARRFGIATVGEDISPTSPGRPYLDGPTNLDFSRLAEDSGG